MFKFSTLNRRALLVFVFQWHLGRLDDAEGELCSRALGFNDSQGPKDRFKQDLLFCTEHHKNTCCERNHTRQVLAWYAHFSHDRSADCGLMGRLGGCSFCDGDVGSGVKSRLQSVVLCPAFCEQWYKSCADDFFSRGSSGSLQPCGSALVCSPLREITQDAATFCSSVGSFEVADSDDLDICYDGVPAATSLGKAPKAPWTKPVPVPPSLWTRISLWFDSTLRGLASGRASTLEDYVPSLIIGLGAFVVVWYMCRGA
uniref:Folate receptor-like domain-containing protein n=1 Tax=Noctiluca scintillans TaxID=2966 RepID=A0A7S1AES5_NOCSC|mmetsp:Transcript_43236/g.113757  ORF Transcript_43236/g.113757 Transcript_43236/m.113757 type:complete len:257 (+) Transcript_43236:6-776(+)